MARMQFGYLYIISKYERWYQSTIDNGYILSFIILITMSIKDKIMNITLGHPKAVTFGIGLAITFAIGLAIGMINHGQMAFAGGRTSGAGSSGT